jgi:hypothetical protein
MRSKLVEIDVTLKLIKIKFIIPAALKSANLPKLRHLPYLYTLP